MNRRGVTLLETMVALVILGLAVVGFLEVFAGSGRLATGVETWARAVAYAEDGLEAVKLDPRLAASLAGPQALDGGFERRVQVTPWAGDLALVTVVVRLPDAGEFRLERLLEAR